MEIGEERLINPPSNYIFPSVGNHTVDIQIDISQITSFANFFKYTNLISISFYPSFYNENIKDMSGFFSGCIKLVSIDMSNFQSQNIINMRNLFESCRSLISLDFSNINTKNVLDMKGMFSGDYSLKILDLSSFNTEKVTDLSYIFSNC